MRRGDVYHIMPRSGSEQTGRRPVIIVSHNAFNDVPGWLSIIVVPLSTSAAQATRGPTAVFIQMGAAGLKRDCVALCHKITTLDRRKITEHIGALSPGAMKEIERGIKAAIDLS